MTGKEESGRESTSEKALKHRSTGGPMGSLKFEGVSHGYRCGT